MSHKEIKHCAQDHRTNKRQMQDVNPGCQALPHLYHLQNYLFIGRPVKSQGALVQFSFSEFRLRKEFTAEHSVLPPFGSGYGTNSLF